MSLPAIPSGVESISGTLAFPRSSAALLISAAFIIKSDVVVVGFTIKVISILVLAPGAKGPGIEAVAVFPVGTQSPSLNSKLVGI